MVLALAWQHSVCVSIVYCERRRDRPLMCQGEKNQKKKKAKSEFESDRRTRMSEGGDGKGERGRGQEKSEMVLMIIYLSNYASIIWPSTPLAQAGAPPHTTGRELYVSSPSTV